MRSVKKVFPGFAFCLVFAGVGASAGPANAQYLAAPGYWSVLTTPLNYRPVNNTLLLAWNPTTAQLPTARAVGTGVQLGTGENAGQCATFCQLMTGAPLTRNWVRGQQALAGGVQPGTLLATFPTWNGQRWTYSGHAAFFVAYGPNNSLIVVDQNWVGGLVAFHSIPRTGRGGVTDSLSFYVVK